MNILLDSHVLLWALTDDARLSQKARDHIMDPDNFIFYSAASVWELSVKHTLHPESVAFTAEELIRFCDEAGLDALDVSVEHVLLLDTLKRPEDAPRHKDPFDRILIAQAKAEGMLFLTHDALLPYYNEKCIIPV